MPLEVFRYSNIEENSEQGFHYMAGEPGNDVEGGWQFQSPEGDNYAVNYRYVRIIFDAISTMLRASGNPVSARKM